MAVSRTVEPQILSSRPRLARRQLRAMLAESGWTGDVEPVLLAVHEGLVNAHRHGGGPCRVSAAVDGNTLIVDICDRGPGFRLDGHDHLLPDAMSERGRGLWIISRVASECEVRREDHAVCLRLRFDAP